MSREEAKRRQHAMNIITNSAKTTKLNRHDFIERRYAACPRWDVTKEEIAAIYDEVQKTKEEHGQDRDRKKRL